VFARVHRFLMYVHTSPRESPSRPLCAARRGRNAQVMPAAPSRHCADAHMAPGSGQILTELVFSSQLGDWLAVEVDGRGDGTGWTPSVTRASQTPS
jgi:hypothetical protein